MNLAEAAEGPPFDVVVVGGGINGCGIAREIASRGLRVALLEASDFGFGTTWRSTRLIHGGLRYLEHGELGLVRESLRERARLLRERPHLVKPQPFVLPQLPWSRRPAWQVRMGLAAYDLLATGGRLPRHSRIGRDALLEATPGIGELANGGFSFHDARAVAPERLALELALEARAAGAALANYANVTAIRSRHGAVSGVDVEWRGKSLSLAAPHVVNAAGPWVDAVAQTANIEGPKLIGATRGSHIALEVPEPVTHAAVLSTAKSDGRVFFALPHSGLLLVGTTDVLYGCDPALVRPAANELQYLLEEARTLFPRATLNAEQVRYSYAGVRPLLASRSGRNASAITRRHAVIDHRQTGGPAGLFSVAGGKLSTYRPLAKEVLRELGCAATMAGDGRFRPRPTVTAATPEVAEHLDRYGANAGSVAGYGMDVLCRHAGAVVGEVEHAVRHELAISVADVLLRRTGVGWHSCRGLCCHAEVAVRMGALLGWDESETSRQIGDYEREVAANLPGWDDIMKEGGG
jgi:glycerol-3-phosphate dehydrogenase